MATSSWSKGDQEFILIAIKHIIAGAEHELKEQIDPMTGRSFFTRKIMKRAREILNAKF